MNTSIRSTWALLRPHLASRLWIAVLVVLLGVLSSIGPPAILALFIPVFELVLFPGEKVEGTGGRGKEWITDLFTGFRDQLLATQGGTSTELSEDSRIAALVAVCTVAVVLAILTAATQFAFTCVSRWFALRLVVDLRMRLARHLVGLSMRYHQQRSFGDLLSRISADVNTLLQTVQQVLREFVQEPAQMLWALGFAFIVAPELALWMFVAIPLLVVPIAYFSRRIRKRSKRSLATLGSSVQSLTQMFQGIRTVKAYRAEEREVEGFRAVNEDYLKHSMRMVKAIALTNAWTAMFSVAGLALLLLPVGWLTIRGGLATSAGVLVFFFMTMSRVYTHVKGMTKAYTQVQESLGASERLQEILDEPADVVEAPDPIRIASLDGGVRFEHVWFSYRDETEPALRDIDLELRSGERVALVGPSGAGKSTLADLLCRFIDPTDGAIVVGGHDLRDVSRDDWCSLVAHVDQVPFLFHTSIAENILYGRPGATRAEIEAAAKDANIHDFIASLPEGYDTNVADAGGRLSGGQRQRIVIARALLRNAPLLILDEATSALDSESEAAVQKALDRLMENRTVVVIAHRLSTIRDADRIAVLEEGRLVELGSHDELVEKAGTYARLHAIQQGGARDVLQPAGTEPRQKTTDSPARVTGVS